MNFDNIEKLMPRDVDFLYNSEIDGSDFLTLECVTDVTCDNGNNGTTYDWIGDYSWAGCSYVEGWAGFNHSIFKVCGDHQWGTKCVYKNR